jgi:hypothetical protein
MLVRQVRWQWILDWQGISSHNNSQAADGRGHAPSLFRIRKEEHVLKQTCLALMRTTCNLKLAV